MKEKKEFRLRLVMTIGGVILCAIAVGFFKCSLFGIDPFQCLAQGIWGRSFSGISFGTYYMVLSLIMLVIDLGLGKEYIGVSTFINMFLTGYIVDFSQNIINRFIPEPGLAVRVIMLAIAVVVMCFASSLYMTSNLGVSVYDAIPIIISKKSEKPFRFCRIGCDLICVIVGVVCGLLPGLGTLITAFCMGPLIEFFNNRFSEPLINGEHIGVR
ncbi:MAG: YitT family protein [Oliverpabstia sp.]